MKKTLFLIFLTSIIFAKEGFNRSGRVDVKGPWTMYISGSYLFYQAKENGLNSAILTKNGIKKPVKMDFKYHSGFSVGALTNFDYDQWGVLFFYTRFDLDNSKRSRGSLEPTKIITPSSYTSNELYDVWDLDYDVIDVNVQRVFYVGKKLLLTPFLGIRGGWINQKDKIEYKLIDNLTHFDATSQAKSDSWLLGPSSGACVKWMIGNDFWFRQKIALSVLYQYFKTHFQQTTENATYTSTINKNIKDKLGYSIANIDLKTAFGYGTYFDKKNWHINISLGYDFIYFYNQNQIRSIIDSLKSQNKTTQDDLILHGLNVKIRLDF